MDEPATLEDILSKQPSFQERVLVAPYELLQEHNLCSKDAQQVILPGDNKAFKATKWVFNVDKSAVETWSTNVRAPFSPLTVPYAAKFNQIGKVRFEFKQNVTICLEYNWLATIAACVNVCLEASNKTERMVFKRPDCPYIPDIIGYCGTRIALIVVTEANDILESFAKAIADSERGGCGVIDWGNAAGPTEYEQQATATDAAGTYFEWNVNPIMRKVCAIVLLHRLPAHHLKGRNIHAPLSTAVSLPRVYGTAPLLPSCQRLSHDILL